VYIGKESNRHEDVDHGLVHDIADVRATYHDPREDPWATSVVPLLRRLPRRRIAKLAGLSARTIQAVRNGRGVPSADTRRALLRAALILAQRVLAHPDGNRELLQVARQLVQLSNQMERW